MGKPNTFRHLAALSLLLILYAAAAQVVHVRGATRFRLLREGFVVVPVYVNDSGPFDFLLDTGTNSTLVTPELAGRLGLRAYGRMSLITVAGSRVVPWSRLNKITLGARSLADVETLVSDLARVRTLDARICGVLGQNFLSGFDYAISYHDRRLEFGGDGVGWEGVRVPYELDEGRIIVSARSPANGGRMLKLVLDAAAPALVLFGRATGPPTLDLAPLESIRAETEAGSRPVTTGRLRSLEIGAQVFSKLPVVLLPDPAGEQRAEDGLLPTNLFRSVYFNHREGYVIFNPRRVG